MTTPTSSLYGREPEMQHLEHLLDRALSGEGGLVLIGGEAGIGKTALVSQFAGTAREASVLVLQGHSYDLTMTPAYGPWIEVVEAYERLQLDPEVPASLSDIETIAHMQSQAELFHEASKLLTSIAGERPLLIILEDLHWADRASLDLLRFVARGLSGRHRLLIAGTYRNDEISRDHLLHTYLPLLVREPDADRIDLRRLHRQAIFDLLQHRYRLSTVDTARIASLLQQQSEGNPLYIGELLRTWEADGVLSIDHGSWSLNEPLSRGTPPLIRQIIERRLDSLEQTQMTYLEIAAVMGHFVLLPAWLAVAGVREEELDGTIKASLERAILEQTDDDQRLQFTHALIRETLYAGIGPSRKRALHKRIAATISEDPHPPPDTVAYHLMHAGEDSAVSWLVKAGDQAFRSWAWIVAAVRYTAAESLLKDQPGSDRERAWLLLKIATVSREIEPRRAVEASQSALSVARHLQDRALEAMATFCLGENLYFAFGTGLPEVIDGVRRLESLEAEDITSLKSHFPGTEIDHAVIDIAVLQALLGHYDDALDGARIYLARGKPVLEHLWPEQGHAEFACAYAYCALGKPDEAANAFSGAQYCYARAGMLQMCYHARATEMQYLALTYAADDVSQRSQLASTILELGAQISGVGAWLDARKGLLPLLLIEGNWEEAIELALPFCNRDVIFNLSCLWVSGVIAREQGDHVRAWQYVNLAIPDGPNVEAGNLSTLFTIEIIQLAAALSMDDDNMTLAKEWIDAHDHWINLGGRVQGRSEGNALHARHEMMIGNTEKAMEFARMAVDNASAPRQPVALMSALRLIGEIERLSGDSVEAMKHLQESLDIAMTCAAPYEEARTRVAIARLPPEANSSEPAIVHLNRAAVICQALDARPLADTIAQLRSAISLQSKPVSYPNGLTAREVEVLRHVAEGLSDSEVAERLFISRRTVTSHLTSIYNKLGVSSRTSATRFAFEQKLLASDADELHQRQP